MTIEDSINRDLNTAKDNIRKACATGQEATQVVTEARWSLEVVRKTLNHAYAETETLNDLRSRVRSTRVVLAEIEEALRTTGEDLFALFGPPEPPVNSEDPEDPVNCDECDAEFYDGLVCPECGHDHKGTR